jgi:hypothetical protein
MVDRSSSFDEVYQCLGTELYFYYFFSLLSIASCSFYCYKYSTYTVTERYQ